MEAGFDGEWEGRLDLANAANNNMLGGLSKQLKISENNNYNIQIIANLLIIWQDVWLLL